ncbi:MAG: DUF1499 domain-containing protein [Gammaproteobacteria bacterium]
MLTKIIIVALCLLSIPVVSVFGALLRNDLPWRDTPGLVTRLQHYLSTNVAETTDVSSYPELVIREYHYPKDTFFSLLETSVAKLGWEIDSQHDQTYTLHAVVTTPLIGYKDDVTIKLIPMTEKRNKLYIRSSSRKGRGDLGTNTRHILDLYNQIEKQMAN